MAPVAVQKEVPVANHSVKLPFLSLTPIDAIPDAENEAENEVENDAENDAETAQAFWDELFALL
jgi:hypothetical protein